VKTVKPRLWILAVLAGLVWLAILLQQKIVRPEEILSKESDIAQETTPKPTPDSAVTSPISSPPASAPTQKSILENTLTAVPISTPTPIQIFHEVQPGDVPGIIAEGYGINVDLLLRLNDIPDPTKLQIGQRLLIPVTATPTPATPPTPIPSPSPTPAPIYYTIQKGDVLLAIAAEYDTTVEAIMIVNDIIDPRTLQIGQELFIPPDKGSILGVPTKIHEIKSGDTLLGLATLYGSTLEDILVTNPDLEPARLQVGQQIIIPLTQPRINPDADPTVPRLTSPSAPPANLIELEQAMVEAVNLERQTANLPALTADEKLTLVARTHGQDMVKRGYFSHVTPGGITLQGRLIEYGLELNWVGENIQRNVQPPNETVRYASNWFMNSRPHRQNMLHTRFSRIGVSVTEGPPGWYTFVLVFSGD
jgi:uncharacterized protein YkwD